MPKSLVANAIQYGHLKEVTIKNIDPCHIEGYVVIEKNKLKKEAVDCFIKLLSEKIQENML